MLSLVALVFTSLLAGLITAQSPTTNFSSSDILRISTEVTQTELNSWCTSEKTTCGTLCGGMVGRNDCDPNALTVNCICSSNNSAPALPYYIGSLTSFICQKAKGDCFALNANDLSSQQTCNTTYVCASLNASDAAAAAATTSSSLTAASSTQASATGSGSATGSAAGASSTAKSFAVKVGQDYGIGILAAGLMAALKLLL